MTENKRVRHVPQRSGGARRRVRSASGLRHAGALAVALALIGGPAASQQRNEVPAPTDTHARTVAPYDQLLPRGARVTFTSTKDGAVLRREENDTWVDVCRAPCETSLDPSRRFHIDGPGMSTSRTFELPAGASRIEASPGSLGLRVGGIVTVSLGGLVALSGLYVYSLSGLCYTHERCDQSQVDSQKATGLSVMGLGLVVVAVGVAMILQGRTTVSTALASSPSGFSF